MHESDILWLGDPARPECAEIHDWHRASRMEALHHDDA
jgi:hypothetical protein